MECTEDWDENSRDKALQDVECQWEYFTEGVPPHTWFDEYANKHRPVENCTPDTVR